MREWVVASGIVETADAVLLVKNVRADGRVDWSPPGGVVEVAEGETVAEGLTREVAEETGITVSAWAGPVWEVEAVAEEMGWCLRVEVHRALRWQGTVRVDDPDGIVVDARFVPVGDCLRHLAEAWLPTHEPFAAWLAERWTSRRHFRYRVEGPARTSMVVTRL